MLVLDEVGKRYGGGRWVVRDVHLELPAGQVSALAGDNGSGKSTLLRIMVGVCRPSQGRVAGRPKTIGYVPDRFPPNERLSAMAYLTHLGRVRGLTGRAARTRAGDLADRLAIVGGRHVPLRTLSKGNAQKVALAQALLVAPELLVLDEPWSGLDRSAHQTLAEIIAEVSGAGGAVVFTDHREAITGTHASRTYRIEDGRVRVADDRPVTTVDVELVRSHAARDVDWRAVTGVRAVARQRGGVAIQVEAASSDDLLVAALRTGWSVRRLNPRR